MNLFDVTLLALMAMPETAESLGLSEDSPPRRKLPERRRHTTRASSAG